MAVDVCVNDAFAALDGIAGSMRQSVTGFLACVGERFCEEARATKTYSDRTGRLSASIGYGVVRDGELVLAGGFGGGDGGAEGMETLRAAVQSVESGSTALVVVAGMGYAAYVERRGYAVLDGARFSADEIIGSLIPKLAL